MAGLAVTPDQLNSLAGQITKSAGDISGLHKALKGQLSPLFGSDWKGAASGQFTELYTKFDQSATSLTEALSGIGQLLKTAGDSYAQAEAQIASSFRG
jgi:WXG100 family type VII secretion target